MKPKYTLLILLILPAMACFQSNKLQATITPATGTAAVPTAITSAPIVYIPSPTGTQEPACIVTANETLNLRELPGTDAAGIAILVRGDQLTILPDPAQGVWIRVRNLDLNIEGWINSNFCKRKN